MICMKDVRKWSTGVAIALLATVATVSFTTPTYAETATSGSDVEITLSPTKVRLPMEPGASKQDVFKVINTGDKDFTFKVYASPYQVSNEKYDPTFSVETSRTQISRWISVPDEEFSLKPGDEVEVPYSIAVPKDVPAGGQYAVIFAETTNDGSDGGSIIAKKRVGLLVYGNISGDTREQGNIESNDLSSWQYSSPLTTQWRVKNTGNTDFAIKTKMTVKSVWGKELYSSPETENTVLPDTVRAIDLQWQQARIGLYKVSTTASFLDNSQTEESWVLVMSPILLVLIVVVISLIVAGAIYAIRKKRHAKKA